MNKAIRFFEFLFLYMIALAPLGVLFLIVPNLDKSGFNGLVMMSVISVLIVLLVLVSVNEVNRVRKQKEIP